MTLSLSCHWLPTIAHTAQESFGASQVDQTSAAIGQAPRIALYECHLPKTSDAECHTKILIQQIKYLCSNRRSDSGKPFADLPSPLTYFSCRFRSFTLVAGTPAYTPQASRSWVATEASPSTAPSPMLTPGLTHAFAQIQA